MKTTPLRWDIFCRIVDNFGDIGVCWRLARQLVNEHGQEVQLWVDDLSVMAALVPGLSEEKSLQCIDGVRVHRWPEHWRDQPVTDVVIEAFACTLPAAYLSALADSARPTLWQNVQVQLFSVKLLAGHQPSEAKPVGDVAQHSAFRHKQVYGAGMLTQSPQPAADMRVFVAEQRKLEVSRFGVRA